MQAKDQVEKTLKEKFRDIIDVRTVLAGYIWLVLTVMAGSTFMLDIDLTQERQMLMIFYVWSTIVLAGIGYVFIGFSEAYIKPKKKAAEQSAQLRQMEIDREISILKQIDLPDMIEYEARVLQGFIDRHERLSELKIETRSKIGKVNSIIEKTKLEREQAKAKKELGTIESDLHKIEMDEIEVNEESISKLRAKLNELSNTAKKENTKI